MFQIFQSKPDEPGEPEVIPAPDSRIVPNSKRTIITDRFTPGVNHTILSSQQTTPTQAVYMNKAPPPPPEKFRPIEFYSPAVPGGMYPTHGNMLYFNYLFSFTKATAHETVVSSDDLKIKTIIWHSGQHNFY